jgi:hypothetical protein
VLLIQYCSGDKIETDEMVGACSSYGVEERPIRYFVGNPEGKRSLGRPRCKWENNIKKGVQKVGCWVYGLDRLFLSITACRTCVLAVPRTSKVGLTKFGN